MIGWDFNFPKPITKNNLTNNVPLSTFKQRPLRWGRPSLVGRAAKQGWSALPIPPDLALRPS